MADRGEIELAAARPMAFFPHDADSARDMKCRKLIRREGMAGYGRWWRLCELMAATDGHALEIGTDEDMELYAEELGYGTAAELMEQKGKYYRLVEIQSMSDKLAETRRAERFS